jgi:hypothetical protein
MVWHYNLNGYLKSIMMFDVEFSMLLLNTKSSVHIDKLKASLRRYGSILRNPEIILHLMKAVRSLFQFIANTCVICLLSLSCISSKTISKFEI